MCKANFSRAISTQDVLFSLLRSINEQISLSINYRDQLKQKAFTWLLNMNCLAFTETLF